MRPVQRNDQQGAEHYCRRRADDRHHLAEYRGTRFGGRRCGQLRGTGRQVPIRCRGHHHRHSLLQGERQYAGRTSATCGRAPAPSWRRSPLRMRLARAGSRCSSRRRWRSRPTRCTWPLTTPPGHYSADVNYFATTGVDNPPLHALADGVSGGNGVFAYGASSAFPNQTWNAANYWVDVVFSP